MAVAVPVAVPVAVAVAVPVPVPVLALAVAASFTLPLTQYAFFTTPSAPGSDLHRHYFLLLLLTRRSTTTTSWTGTAFSSPTPQQSQHLPQLHRTLSFFSGYQPPRTSALLLPSLLASPSRGPALGAVHSGLCTPSPPSACFTTRRPVLDTRQQRTHERKHAHTNERTNAHDHAHAHAHAHTAFTSVLSDTSHALLAHSSDTFITTFTDTARSTHFYAQHSASLSRFDPIFTLNPSLPLLDSPPYAFPFATFLRATVPSFSRTFIARPSEKTILKRPPGTLTLTFSSSSTAIVHSFDSQSCFD